MKEVIARLKSNQKISQVSKPEKAEVPQETEIKKVPQETQELRKDAEDDYIDEDDQNVPEIDPKSDDTPNIDQQIAMEIELLQNDGRYRAEQLHQLQEINKSLLGMAEILVDLANKNGKA